jgi:hypothetical protein
LAIKRGVIAPSKFSMVLDEFEKNEVPSYELGKRTGFFKPKR